MLRIAFIIALIMCITLGYFWYKVPKKELFAWQSYSSLYYDRHKTPLRLTLAKDDRYRLHTSYENLPKALIQASILYEDKYFFSHPGVNIPALWKAFVSTYLSKTRRVGASTITMQVARVAFHLRSKTVLGKVKQIFYALWLEQHYSKEQILEFYFNVVSYGGNIEGIEAASQIYFHKDAINLSVPEVLSLVVIPQNPLKRNPSNKRGYTNMLEARKRLYLKYETLYILKENKERVDMWMELPLKIYKSKNLPFLAPHFINYLIKKYPFKNGKIYTTLDMPKQKSLEKEIKQWVNIKNSKGINNAAALLIDTKSMAIQAWVGSADFYNRAILGEVDGITAKRSPGSLLKPFVYALALDQGLIHPNSLLKDAPSRFGAYTPENFDKTFLGPISATQALVTSRNVPAVRLSSKLKNPDLYDALKASGITQMKEKKHYGMSIALGGMETSMLEVARLYAMLANEGNLKTIRVLRDEYYDENLSLISKESAWLSLDMLKHNPAVNLKKYIGLDKKEEKYAWKTGTSYAFRDAWSAGISKDSVLVTWVGNFNGRGNHNFVGRTAAGPLFFKMMKSLSEKEIHADNEPKDLNIALVDICKSTGALPSKLCPRLEKSWFIPGVSPIKSSLVYREIPINIKTKKRACLHVPGITSLEVFEFWPSDILHIFKLAGINKKKIPAFEASCSKLSSLTQVPQIHSPAKNLIYTLEEGKLKTTLIPFEAVLDADSHKAFWFLNTRYIGSSIPEKVFFWKARLGQYKLRVVDENGLSASRTLVVELAQ